MSKSSKGILIASGCSYTDKDYYSDVEELDDHKRGGWSVWPEVLADKLGLDVVNLARSGGSNDFIYEGILNTIQEYGDRVKVVCPLWSSWDRFIVGFTETEYYPFVTPFNVVERDEGLEEYGSEFSEEYIKFYKGQTDRLKIYMPSMDFHREVFYKSIEDDNLLKIANNTFSKMHHLNIICKSRDIKIIQWQGIENTNNFYKGKMGEKNMYKYFNDIMDNIYYDDLDDQDNIIGWPFYQELNGYDVDAAIMSQESPADLLINYVTPTPTKKAINS